MFRELEFTLKVMRAHYKTYVDPAEILKMATTNTFKDRNISSFDEKTNKSLIKENHSAELFIAKRLSKNHYLSLINRSEMKDIKCIINKREILSYHC